jgi:hypothetical protein
VDEVKARWEALLGVAVTPDKDGFLLRSPTGFPLAIMDLSKGPGGKIRPCFGHPIAAQKEWIREHQDRKVPERSKRLGCTQAPESEGLEPLIVGDSVVGYESDINGPDAELVDFKPTRAELRTLAYHYLGRYFTVQREFYARGQSGTWEIREDAFTWQRFQSIAEALSPGETIKEFQAYIESKQAEVEEVRREMEETAVHEG